MKDPNPNKPLRPIEEVIRDHKSETLDGRDLHRLVDFLTADQVRVLIPELKEDGPVADHKPTKQYTRESVLYQLKSDLAFAFEKALGKRGLSAGMMFEVIKMWNWLLQEDVKINVPEHSAPADLVGRENYDPEYAQYGLPYLKATALHYGFDNPIGDDIGNEAKYAAS